MLLMSTFWILKISRSTLLAGNIFIAVFYVALFLLILRSAGPNSMIHIFFAVLMILSFLICGFRSGIVWGVLIILELLVSKALAVSGHKFVPLRIEAVFISIFILLIMTFLLAAIYEKSSHNNMDKFTGEKEKSDQIARKLEVMFDDVREVMAEVAKGDLSKTITVEAEGALAGLKESINSALLTLRQSMSEVMAVSQEITTGTDQLTIAAQSLASGATEQAASLEEMSSSMEDISSKAKTNTENAQQVQGLASQTADTVVEVNKRMATTLNSMNSINQSSADVSKVIGVIEEIAFQTNLLALNAAVEAARAGKYGKGFAVVAEEVRNLARRSAEAVNNTTELIEASRKEVEEGVRNTGSTEVILKEISGSIEKTNDLVGEISYASDEQTSGIMEVNRGFTQINEIIQHNTSISEETASASEALSDQAKHLENLMSKFRLAVDDAKVFHAYKRPFKHAN
jgi:methyl-accepting chemotaxis protein